MRRPRCGLPDRKAEEVGDGVRKKRYTLTGQQWHKDHITYRFMALKRKNKTMMKQSGSFTNSNISALV